MSWLTPLGFLGLISILMLIIIYIIKPNYENKFISSTYVWKLSLKYKKNKIPVNKLRNIILFICQVLALTAASLIIAQPFLDDGETQANEKVIIVDASASMMTKTGTSTRFERAIYEVKDEITEQLNKDDGKVSVIIAGDQASFLVQSEGIDAKARIFEELDKLIAKNANTCTWGDSDIAGAIKLSETITSVSESVEVSLFTDTNYIDKGKVKVTLVNDVSDVNVAILDVRAVNVENYYRFEIDLVSYGQSNSVNLKCTIKGVNGLEGEEGRLNLEYTANLECDVVETIAFGYKPENEEEDDYSIEIRGESIEVFEYESVEASVNERDSFGEDNYFNLYGGKRPTLSILYYSEKPNIFFRSAFIVLRKELSYRWNIEVTEVTGEDVPVDEGYDFYIYEHVMPTSLPETGFVLLVNPDRIPLGAGFSLGGVKGFYEPTPLTSAEEESAIMKGLSAEEIEITRYLPITNYDGFTPILTCNDEPVFIVKNEPDEKVAVLSLSLHYSNLPLTGFPLMIYNLIEYYSPSTVTKYVYDIGDEVELGARSESLTLSGPEGEQVITEFPAKFTFNTPGTYVAEQTPISGELETDKFFVKIPASESNINRTEDKLVNPYFFEQEEDTKVDLLIFFASALVALLFIEWWLHTREQYKIGKQK